MRTQVWPVVSADPGLILGEEIEHVELILAVCELSRETAARLSAVRVVRERALPPSHESILRANGL